MRGRAWTLEEDERIREAARLNRRPGGFTFDYDDESWQQRGPREYARRLAEVAKATGRTREAVYKRAQRLGARSKQPAYFGRKGKP